jgi:hypothetical protein
MKKQPFVSEKSKLIAEKSAGLNTKINQIETDLDNETLRIATKPRTLTIKVTSEKNCNYAEHYPQRYMQLRSNRNWIKRNPDYEPEISNGMSLMSIGDWEESEDNTDRDEFDIEVSEKIYRVIIDKTLDRIWCREISEYDYTGRALFKNPIHKGLLEQWLKTYIELNPPKNTRKDTLNKFNRDLLKLFKQEENNLQLKKKSRGQPPKANLRKSAAWCIEHHPKGQKNRSLTIAEAYKKYGETHIKESFITTVRKKWNEINAEYRKLWRDFNKQNPKVSYAEFKKQNSKVSYAKKTIKNPPKQKKTKS